MSKHFALQFMNLPRSQDNRVRNIPIVSRQTFGWLLSLIQGL
jgi:hypothetical protein